MGLPAAETVEDGAGRGLLRSWAFHQQPMDILCLQNLVLKALKVLESPKAPESPDFAKDTAVLCCPDHLQMGQWKVLLGSLERLAWPMMEHNICYS
jgi:hypothetical protein